MIGAAQAMPRFADPVSRQLAKGRVVMAAFTQSRASRPQATPAAAARKQEDAAYPAHWTSKPEARSTAAFGVTPAEDGQDAYPADWRV